MHLDLYREKPYCLGVQEPPEEYARKIFGQGLSQFVVDALSEAYRLTGTAARNWVSSGQSRQAWGTSFRQNLISELVRKGPGFGLRRVSVDPEGQLAPVHRDPLAADLMQVEEMYLWPTRLSESGRFMHGPSSTIRSLAATAQSGRPLFQDDERPYFGVLYFVLDTELDLVARAGIGLPNPKLTGVGWELISDLRAHALSQRESTTSARVRRHALRLRGDNASLPADTEATKSDTSEN